MEQQQSEEAPLTYRAWQPLEKEEAFLAADPLSGSTFIRKQAKTTRVAPGFVQCVRSWLDGALAHTGVLLPVTAKESYSLEPLGFVQIKTGILCIFSCAIHFFLHKELKDISGLC